MDQARRCNEAEGFVAGDRIANLYPLANFPTGAFLSVVRSAMIGGYPIVYGLTGAANSELRSATRSRVDRRGRAGTPDGAVGRAELPPPVPG